MKTIPQILSAELNQPEAYIQNVIALLDEGNTIPFIARYRKEAHGAMDDTTLRALETRLQYLKNLQSRRDEVKSSIESRGKLTDELSAAIDEAATLAEVEDLYRPYKQKRRTRATVAREKGLEPLAEAIFAQTRGMAAPDVLAQDYLDAEKGVETVADALQGANDILAEQFSDDAEIRKSLRGLMQKRAAACSKASDPDADSVYRLYYEFSQPVAKLQSHQVLALNRGEKEGFLKVGLDMDRDAAIQTLRRLVVKPGSPAMTFVAAAAEDSYDRLIFPSLEREIRNLLTDAANEAAIRNFALNLKPLLMQPPVKGFVTMGLDPGYSHGCKVAVVDATGKVLDTTVVYPTFGERQKREAITKLAALIRKHHVAHLAVGNGTASRETEAMAVELIREVGGGVSYMIVNEAGASVYSASKLAADEFPQYDVNLRSAVSIARRLQDPLAELVKIDPKAIGVGQYQHDMPEKELSAALDAVVEDCVNAVGVDLNTASAPLLQQVSGLNATTAKNIVAYREEHGAFTARSQLKEVPEVGPEAFQQCAGFLRVPESKQILDRYRGGASRKLCRRRNAASAPWLSGKGRRNRRDASIARRAETLWRGKSRGGMRRRRPDASGYCEGAGQARPRPARRAARADPPYRCAGAEGSQARHGAHRHGPQCHRFRCLCRHRRPSGRPCPHFPRLRPLYQAPVRGARRRRCGQGRRPRG